MSPKEEVRCHMIIVSRLCAEMSRRCEEPKRLGGGFPILYMQGVCIDSWVTNSAVVPFSRNDFANLLFVGSVQVKWGFSK